MQVDWKSKVKLLKDSFDSHLGGVVLLTPHWTVEISLFKSPPMNLR